MKRTYIKDLTEGQCKIKGMVETIRDKKIMFIVIRDVTGAVQVTIEKDKCPEVYAEAKKLTPHLSSGIVAVTEVRQSFEIRNRFYNLFSTKL